MNAVSDLGQDVVIGESSPVLFKNVDMRFFIVRDIYGRCARWIACQDFRFMQFSNHFIYRFLSYPIEARLLQCSLLRRAKPITYQGKHFRVRGVFASDRGAKKFFGSFSNHKPVSCSGYSPKGNLHANDKTQPSNSENVSTADQGDMTKTT